MIDCSEDTIGAGVGFWSGALGLEATQGDDPSDPYTALKGGIGGLFVALQRIGGASRVHLDFETDNVEAEVRRLEELGAQRKEQIENWWVMEAPSGHVFCVVPQFSKDFLETAAVWED